MKKITQLSAVLLALGVVSQAGADPVVYITGSTAFRSTIMTALLNNTGTNNGAVFDTGSVTFVTYGNASATSCNYAVVHGTNNGSPNSDGWIFEVNYLPFSNGGPEFWPWLNFRVGLQYTLYNHFNGGTVNYDGAGSKASGNNTLYLYVLTAF